MVTVDLLSLLLVLRCLDLGEHGIESLEALLPVLAIALNPCRDVTQRLGAKPPRPPLRPPSPLDQTRPLEHAEVLRHRWLGQREWLRENLHRGITLREPG